MSFALPLLMPGNFSVSHSTDGHYTTTTQSFSKSCERIPSIVLRLNRVLTSIVAA